MDTSLNQIDDRRSRLGIAQSVLCRRADVSESTLSRARQTGKMPTKRILRKLAVALDQIAQERGVVIVEKQS